MVEEVEEEAEGGGRRRLGPRRSPRWRRRCQEDRTLEKAGVASEAQGYSAAKAAERERADNQRYAIFREDRQTT
eukprot:9027964-Pyramimonas_sp.AAC.1